MKQEELEVLTRLNRRVERLNTELENNSPAIVVDLELNLIKEAVEELQAVRK